MLAFEALPTTCRLANLPGSGQTDEVGLAQTDRHHVRRGSIVALPSFADCRCTPCPRLSRGTDSRLLENAIPLVETWPSPLPKFREKEAITLWVSRGTTLRTIEQTLSSPNLVEIACEECSVPIWSVYESHLVNCSARNPGKRFFQKHDPAVLKHFVSA